MSSADEEPQQDFTLDAMLMRRDSAEHAFDDEERVHLVNQFSSYADAFVAHVPHTQAAAFQSTLLARYLSFLPAVDGEVTQPIRSLLESALADLATGSADAGTLEVLWRALSLARDAKEGGRWVEDEHDMPLITVLQNVLKWARGALTV